CPHRRRCSQAVCLTNFPGYARGLMRRLVSALTVAFVSVVTSASIRAAGPDDEALDCGPNSLYLLLQLSGYRADLDTLKRLLPSRPPPGYSMLELKAAARANGLRLRGIRFGKRDVPLDRPAIAFLNHSGSGHFVVLRPVGVTGTMVQIIEPP